MTASALYRGTIRHRRRTPHAHAFTHRITLAYVDLAEQERGIVPRRLRLRREDHLGDPAMPLARAARALVAERTGAPAPGGPVRVLTQPRSFGVGFTPVSFVYLLEEDGTLGAVIADVTSTPWQERCQYVLRGGAGPLLRGEHRKAMHVSPFLGMEHRYGWRATTPGATLSVHIAVDDVFDATLNLTRAPLTAARRATPNARTLALIYGHALALKLRGVPVHPHPGAAAP